MSRALFDFANRHHLGEVTASGGYVLSRNPDTVRAPAAAWISVGRLSSSRLPEDAWVDGAPTLAIEVASGD